MVALRTLYGVAAVGGMVTALTGYTLHGILQKRVRDSPVYKETMKIINTNPVGSRCLGVPVRSDNVDVTNSNNILSQRYCQLELPVYGSRCKGKIYLQADRLTAEDEWNLYKLELEVLDDLGGKVNIINKEPALQKETTSF
ncbi:uncharacterized protein LOC128997524 [Macrosteles quadrilineatus]|uniref:uncharacterized protein LOC128997524 n=1 Tax=Macrosteles quadrilineatus TaxID=74068 RepID=UPI0023E26EF0|nr:uncharacterized protein LOC128997524 [Macrosteles quadrilineatus]